MLPWCHHPHLQLRLQRLISLLLGTNISNSLILSEEEINLQSYEDGTLQIMKRSRKVTQTETVGFHRFITSLLKWSSRSSAATQTSDYRRHFTFRGGIKEHSRRVVVWTALLWCARSPSIQFQEHNTRLRVEVGITKRDVLVGCDSGQTDNKQLVVSEWNRNRENEALMQHLAAAHRCQSKCCCWLNE